MPPISAQDARALVSEIKGSIARIDGALEVLAIRCALSRLEQSIDKLEA